MNQINFKKIYKAGKLVLENELYKHVHKPDMLLQYDSNFIMFKKMPTLEEFIAANTYLREFHEKNGQKHVRYYFPERETLSSDLTDFLKRNDFTIGFLELYAILPANFPEVSENLDIVVQKVTEETLTAYLDFQYEQDSQYGQRFAEQKQAQHRRNFQNEKICQIIAFYKGQPAGTVDVILCYSTAEIDGLTVNESFQRKGIGSRLQKYVMELFHDKVIILVADGQDTPKEMYQKQNYEYLGFQYEGLKVYE